MRVVVGANLSQHSDEAIRQGDAWARAHGWTLRVCHVAPALHPKLDQALRDHVAELIGRRDVEIVVKTGAPDAALVHEDAQLLVVGSHSQDGLKQFLLGDVAESVVRHARSTVLVARPRRHTGPILVASDFSEAADFALDLAADHAQRTRAQLILVSTIERRMRVVRELTSFGAAYGFVENEYEDAHAAAEKRLKEQLGGVPGTTLVLEGPPVPAMVHAADDAGAELIAVAFGKRHFRPGIAEKLASAAPCSVLVTRPPSR